MNKIIEQMALLDLRPGQLIPDATLHRFAGTPEDKDELAWYICYQLFSCTTQEPYFYCMFGDIGRAITSREIQTLLGATSDDRSIIKRKSKDADKKRIKFQNEVMKTAGDGIADAYYRATKSTILNFDEPLRPMPDSTQFIKALGFKEKDYFFTSSNNRQIVCISKFGEDSMLGLMPLAYWETAFPGSGAQRVDWTAAKSSLMHDARDNGIFQSRHVRGAGVWRDAGRIVVNMGDHLLVDGQERELSGIDSRYFYTLGNSLSRLHERPLSADECGALTDVCETFKWSREDNGFLLAGYLVISRVCGALPVRPHLWVTGGAQTGKSTLFDRLIKPMLGPNTIFALGTTTEAGLRQSLLADAVPVMFDEIESSNSFDAQRIASVIDLMRSAWTETEGMIIKGGATGSASAFQIRCCAIFSSIRTRLVNDADLQRFGRIELRPHGDDAVHYAKLVKQLEKIDEEYSERLFSRTIKMLPILLENFKVLKRVMALKAGQRFADQYGMLLAGYSILMQDDVISENQAQLLANHVQLNEEKENAKVTDHEDSLGHLLTKRLKLDSGKGAMDWSVGEAILEAHGPAGDEIIKKSLQRVGIAVGSEAVGIAVKHTELEAQVYSRTNWSQTWANSLARLPGAVKNKVVWMAGRSVKAVSLPISLFKPDKSD